MPGLHCLRIETLLQVHYLCFRAQSTSDAWLKELQDRVAEVHTLHHHNSVCLHSNSTTSMHMLTASTLLQLSVFALPHCNSAL
jgi:hypothetical protein